MYLVDAQVDRSYATQCFRENVSYGSSYLINKFMSALQHIYEQDALSSLFSRRGH